VPCPEVLGDPGLLLPRIYDEPQPKRWEIGLVPHYVHLEEAARLFRLHTFIKTISPLCADPRPTIDLIRSCDLIASSSLHGLIAAEAYGIPHTWITFPDAKRQLNTDGSKFIDFYESLPSRRAHPLRPLEIRSSKDLWQCSFTEPVTTTMSFSPLWEARDAMDESRDPTKVPILPPHPTS